MIIFDLSCTEEHRFEGWFRSAEEFASQLERGLVSCPHCGSISVRRLPSAVHLGSSDVEPVPTGNQTQQAGGHLSPAAIAKALVEHLMNSSEDVGSAFAEEARRIHYHESPERAIRGKASEDEFSALQEEGIDVLRLPKIKSEDLN